MLKRAVLQSQSITQSKKACRNLMLRKRCGQHLHDKCSKSVFCLVKSLKDSTPLAVVTALTGTSQFNDTLRPHFCLLKCKHTKDQHEQEVAIANAWICTQEPDYSHELTCAIARKNLAGRFV